MLSAYWLKTGHDAAGRRLRWLEALLDKWEHGFESLRETYRQILYWALQRPRKLVALALLSLFLNALLLPFLGSEFQPTYDSGEFNINVMAPAGTSIERSKELMAQVEKEVMAIPELESAYMVVGTNRQVYRSMVGIRLVDSSKRSRSMMQIMDSLRVQFRNVKGLKVSVSTGQSQGRGDSRPIQVALRGPELDTLNQYANTLAEKIKQIPGTTDVDISSEQSEPEVQVKFDPNRLGDVGLDATAAGKAVQIAFLGSTAKNQYNVADSDYDIRVQLKQENRLSLEDVANLRISGQHGFIRLGDIAEVKLSSGPTQIDREDRQRQVIVYANAVGTSPGEVIAKVKEFIPGLNLPMGYTHKLVGQAQMMESSFKEISKALILAVVLIYMVLAAEFESFIHPLTIMLSLPFSLVGAVLGLLIAGNTINIMSLIGVIMLMGLVTKNAILLVDYANQQREQGVPIIEALVEAGSVRLRPILMTTMAMIFGMLPIALGIGAGAEIRSSMGVALIGGLITSTFLTLVIIPLVYLLIDKMQNYFKEEKPDLTEKNPGA
jgi:HAE1 family hydrophobic/amphiphilic exporter-1